MAIILNNVALSVGVATIVINIIINVFEVHNPKNMLGPIGNSVPTCRGTGVLQTQTTC
jgi:hypothetical protein